ncbi:MAG: hypothetical protein AB7O28_12550 [Vicinamibacterales bacterium]
MPYTPSPPPFDAVAAYGIGGLAVFMAGAVGWVWRRHAPRSAPAAIGVLGAWMIGTASLAASGALARFDRVPPPMPLFILSVFVLAFGVGLSTAGATLARAVPLSTLIGLQAFRLPLELVMHRAGTLGIMPPELSYGGYNFDVLTGAGALALWLLGRAGVAVPRAAVWTWNVWGLWCLAVITAIAITTSPMVRAFGDDPRHVNTWVLYFPYVWLPAVLVLIALAGHLVIARALLAGRPAA